MKNTVKLLIGVGLVSSVASAQQNPAPVSTSRVTYKELAPQVAAMVTPAARNPSAIGSMDIPEDQLATYFVRVVRAIENSQEFGDKQVLDIADAALAIVSKAPVDQRVGLLAAAFTQPMTEALTGVSESIGTQTRQDHYELTDDQFKGIATAVVREVNTQSARVDSEATVAVRMALAAATFASGANETQRDPLAQSLNTMIPEAFQKPDPETNKTLIGLAMNKQYERITQITGVPLWIDRTLPPPPPPMPFNVRPSNDPVLMDPGRYPLLPKDEDGPFPPIPPPYNNQLSP